MKLILCSLLFLTSCSFASKDESGENQSELDENARLLLLKEELSADIRELIRDEILPEIELLSPLSRESVRNQESARERASNKVILGRVEWIGFKDNEMKVRARIDTGAQTSSLHAVNIEEKTINDEQYVQFETFDDEDNRFVFLKRVVRTAIVRSTSGEANRRYVVLMNLRLGEYEHEVQVNLSDREKLEHKMLVGRNLLMGRYVVDVSQSRLLGD